MTSRVLAVAAALLLVVGLRESAIAIAADMQFDVEAQRAAAAPDDLVAGNELRRSCREHGWIDRCIEFFELLVRRHPDVRAAHYNASLAYVDKLPGLSLLSQARLSTNSMDQVSTVLTATPDDWLALYIRGLNNLYWPLWYKRTDRAIADLKRCVQISELLGPDQLKPYMGLAYLALGDVYARLGRVPEAQEAWRKGADRHPLAELTRRLALPAEQVASSVEAIRSRDVPIDTDVSFYAANLGQRRAGVE